MVSGYARVSGDAMVSENAIVSGDAVISENAIVSGDAVISGDARVSENARVYGNARVFGNVMISEDARVSCDSDYILIKGVGSNYRNTTFFKTKTENINVICGCFRGNLSEFENKVRETHGNTKFAREYLAAISMVKIHFEIDN